MSFCISCNLWNLFSSPRSLRAAIFFRDYQISLNCDHLPHSSSPITCNYFLMENCGKKLCFDINRRLCWCGHCKTVLFSTFLWVMMVFDAFGRIEEEVSRKDTTLLLLLLLFVISYFCVVVSRGPFFYDIECLFLWLRMFIFITASVYVYK